MHSCAVDIISMQLNFNTVHKDFFFVIIHLKLLKILTNITKANVCSTKHFSIYSQFNYRANTGLVQSGIIQLRSLYYMWQWDTVQRESTATKKHWHTWIYYPIGLHTISQKVKLEKEQPPHRLAAEKVLPSSWTGKGLGQKKKLCSLFFLPCFCKLWSQKRQHSSSRKVGPVDFNTQRQEKEGTAGLVLYIDAYKQKLFHFLNPVKWIGKSQ